MMNTPEIGTLVYKVNHWPMASKIFANCTLHCSAQCKNSCKISLTALLKGVRFSEMLSVVNFMYCGEVSVAQEDLNTFLSVAEELQVKGLTQNQNNTDRGENTGTGTAAPIRRDVKLKKPAAANCGGQESSTKSHSYRKFATAPMENEDTDDIQEMVPVKAEFTNEDDAAPADPREVMMFNDQDETYAEAEYDEPYGSFEHQQEQFGNNLMATDDGNKGNVFYICYTLKHTYTIASLNEIFKAL